MSHRHASRRIRPQKQADTSRVVRSTCKPDPVFYRLALAAAGAPPEQVLFVGDNLQADVIAPLTHGMRAVLVRPQGLRQGETLPDGALLIEHVRELPALLETM